MPLQLVSEDVAQWMQRVLAVLKQNEEALGGTVGDKLRRQILDLLGESASAYRWKVAGPARAAPRHPPPSIRNGASVEMASHRGSQRGGGVAALSNHC